MYDTIVIGAGVGGLSSSLLRSLSEKKVLLLEHHSLIGGCSSYFKRGPYSFDVGATTISGMEKGQPLFDFCQRLSIDLPLKKIDPGIVFHLSSGKTLKRFSDDQKWQNELSHIQSTNPKFWNHVHQINKTSWSVLQKLRPFNGMNLDLILKSLDFEVIRLLPYFLMSGEQDLNRFQTPNRELVELVNGINLISAQALSHQIPAFVSAMSLAYPAETYYPIGGMMGVMEFFEKQIKQRGIALKKKITVSEINLRSGHVEVATSKGETFQGQKVICNLTHWALSSLLNGREKIEMIKESEARPEGPAAFTLYFVVKLKEQVSELYQQVHLKHPEIKNYFISFSLPGDSMRAPNGEQTVTISTHVDAKDWKNLSPDDYAQKKTELTEFILSDFKNKFQVEEIKLLTSGTPKTFSHYTKRPDGMVGGLPLLMGDGPWSFFTPILNDPRIMRVGDTVFPGQGWVGVVGGALNLDGILQKS